MPESGGLRQLNQAEADCPSCQSSADHDDVVAISQPRNMRWPPRALTALLLHRLPEAIVKI
jgi:hypothetical protein